MTSRYSRKGATGKLTARQEAILRYIADVTELRGYAPTLRDIAQSLAFSVGTVHAEVVQLQRMDIIHRDSNRARAVSLTTGYGELQSDRKIVTLPLVSRIRDPGLMSLQPEGYFAFSANVAESDWAVVRVRGDAMTPAGLLDGDLVLVEPAADVSDRSIVAVAVNGEVVIRRLLKSDGPLRLSAERPEHPDVVIDPAHIVGVVRVMMREM